MASLFTCDTPVSREWHAEAEAVVRNLPVPEPLFTHLIGWADTYDALFGSRFAHTTEIDGLLQAAIEHGRVIVSGRGGSGKTVILIRLMQIALRAGVTPILVDLRNWTGADYKRVEAIRANSSELLRFLLRGFASPAVSLPVLDALPPQKRKLLIVDGLNELRSPVASQILEALGQFTQLLVSASVVVADRMVRRDVPPYVPWKLAFVLPLSAREVRRHVARNSNREAAYLEADEATRSVLEVPFFLDQFLYRSSAAPSTAAALRQYFRDHAISDEDISIVAPVAFQMYEISGSRSFHFHAFADSLPAELVTRLSESGVIEIGDRGCAFFRHHLQHDYLASVYVASAVSRWDPQYFDVVTFKASHFDPLLMVSEQLADCLPDTFVRRLYDWNPYAAAYVLSEGYQRERTGVTSEMETVVLAVMAERKFDLILASAQQATDALRLFHSAHASRFLEAESLEEVQDLVSTNLSALKWYNDWQQLFTKRSGAAASPEELRSLFEVDSIVGWTSSNVLKRLQVSENLLEELTVSLEDVSSTIRWRVVHVLGAFPNRERAALVASCVDDPDSWVRYGAIRSLVEMAALTTDGLLRLQIVDMLLSQCQELPENDQRLGQLARALFVRPEKAPSDWLEFVRNVLSGVYLSRVTQDASDRWAKLAADASQLYRAQAAA